MANQSMQTQVNSQGTPLPVPVQTNESQAEQQLGVPQQQHHQQSFTSQQYLYQQQLLKRNFQQGSISFSQMQPPIQQLLQQQNLIQPNQLHSDQQSTMQPSVMSSSQLNPQQKQLYQNQVDMAGTSSSGDLSRDASDWRSQLQAEARQRIVNKISDTLRRHLPFSGAEGLQELTKISVRFEEKIYAAATSQSDYLRKISLKMLTMEKKNENRTPNSVPGNFVNDPNLADPVLTHNQLVADLQCKMVNWMDNLGSHK